VFATLAGAPGRPYSWDSWEWNSSLFPDPRRFTTWAHRNGLSLAVNIHPSISSDDPRYTAANSQAGGLATSSGTCQILMADPTAQCHVFDWTKPRQLAGYFALHRPFALDGVDFFWLDWCCDASRASAPGLTADTWINEQYANEQRLRGSRWPAFSRVGASYSETLPDDGDGQNGGAGIFAEHRYSIQFTGDTCATWPMLAFEARLSASEGNVGLPYVSDDIGSFNGQPTLGQCSAQTGLLNEHLPDDMYARWVALGTFQPLDRLHSNHGDRLPWEYGAAADRAAAGFLRLREALNPYIYTLARETYDSGLPITGALYLSWPRDAAAYRHSTEYTFGAQRGGRAGHEPRRSGPRELLGSAGSLGRLLHRQDLRGSCGDHGPGAAVADPGPDQSGRSAAHRTICRSRGRVACEPDPHGLPRRARKLPSVRRPGDRLRIHAGALQLDEYRPVAARPAHDARDRPGLRSLRRATTSSNMVDQAVGRCATARRRDQPPYCRAGTVELRARNAHDQHRAGADRSTAHARGPMRHGTTSSS
jgi:hypothetical protein